MRLTGRLAAAGVTEGLQISSRKPEWLRAPVRHDRSVLALRHTMRDLGLATVCEEAGCPNLSECWADGTATFMINGASCTRACGFCLVDTSHPVGLDAEEPRRVAEAVRRMGIAHAVVTAVARDDLADGGASGFVATIEAIRRAVPGVAVEVLIPDCKGDRDALDAIYSARPDVLNHNVETVPRLQRAVRPSAGYARTLAVLARAKQSGLTTKSGIIVGMGETDDEVIATLADLRSVGVDIVTIGQYLRPTSHHLPVARWVEPDTFAAFRRAGEAFGIAHVESSPLDAVELPRAGRRRGRAAGARAPYRVGMTAPTAAYAERLHRVRGAMADNGIDVLLLSVGADLPWLTGYEAMPLERLTMFVAHREGEATLVVPRLEAPRVVEQPGVFTIRRWDETDDPIAIVAELAGPAGTAAIGDTTWARFLLALQREMPATSFSRAIEVTGALRARRRMRQRSTRSVAPERLPTGSRPRCRAATSHSWGAPRRLSPPKSPPGCSRKATIR